MRTLVSFVPSCLGAGAAVSVLLGASSGCAPPKERHVYGASAGGIHLDGAEDDGEPAATDDGDPPPPPTADDGAPPPPDDPPADDGGHEPPPGGSDGGIPDDDPPGSPYVGGWDIGNCQDSITPSGSGVGQVVPDLVLTDQFGDQVRLYDFCHKAVFLVAGAFW